MAEETEQITPEAEQESFREYVERREDEVSGRNLERDKQAQSIADVWIIVNDQHARRRGGGRGHERFPLSAGRTDGPISPGGSTPRIFTRISS